MATIIPATIGAGVVATLAIKVVIENAIPRFSAGVESEIMAMRAG